MRFRFRGRDIARASRKVQPTTRVATPPLDRARAPALPIGPAPPSLLYRSIFCRTQGPSFKSANRTLCVPWTHSGPYHERGALAASFSRFSTHPGDEIGGPMEPTEGAVSPSPAPTLSLPRSSHFSRHLLVRVGRSCRACQRRCAFQSIPTFPPSIRP